MAVKNSVQAIELTTFDAANLMATYTVINANGLQQACFLIRIVNDSNVDITISYDGATDHDFVLSNDSLIISVQNNSQPNNYIAKFSAGTKIYVKGSAGMGTIYLSGYYQPQL